MSVHNNSRNAEGLTQNQVGCFPPYAGKCNQLIQGGGNFTVESLHQFSAAGL